MKRPECHLDVLIAARDKQIRRYLKHTWGWERPVKRARKEGLIDGEYNLTESGASVLVSLGYTTTCMESVYIIRQGESS